MLKVTLSKQTRQPNVGPVALVPLVGPVNEWVPTIVFCCNKAVMTIKTKFKVNCYNHI